MSEMAFVSFYPDALLHLSRLRDYEASDVFYALCKHVDAFGYCDPGDERLGVLSGHRRDAIAGILERLQSNGYIHIILTSVPYRPKPLRGFQISPYVLRLRVENQMTAQMNWNNFVQLTPSYEKQTTPIIHAENDQQPDQNQNQNQEPDSKTESETETQSDLRVISETGGRPQTSAYGADQSEKPFDGKLQNPKTGQEPGEEQGEARTELEPPSQARAVLCLPPVVHPPLWEPKKLTEYKRALPVHEDENVALDMVSLAGDLSRENARMLVDTYGWEWCTWVMTLYKKEHYSVEHPARWMRSMLRKTTTEPAQREASNNG